MKTRELRWKTIEVLLLIVDKCMNDSSQFYVLRNSAQYNCTLSCFMSVLVIRFMLQHKVWWWCRNLVKISYISRKPNVFFAFVWYNDGKPSNLELPFWPRLLRKIKIEKDLSGVISKKKGAILPLRQPGRINWTVLSPQPNSLLV